MATPQMISLFSPQPFSGKIDEDFETFVLQLRSAINVNDVQPNSEIHFLRLKLQGNTLQFFERLDGGDRVDLDTS